MFFMFSGSQSRNHITTSRRVGFDPAQKAARLGTWRTIFVLQADRLRVRSFASQKGIGIRIRSSPE